MLLRAPALVACAGVVAGVLVGEAVGGAATAVAALLAAVFLLLSWALRRRLAVVAVAWSAFFLLGAWAVALDLVREPALAPWAAPEAPCNIGTAALWRGVVASAGERVVNPASGSFGTRVRVALLAQQCDGRWWPRPLRVRLLLRPGELVRRGDAVELRLALQPLGERLNPMEPDPRLWGRLHGVQARADVLSEHAVWRRSTDGLAFLDAWRAAVAQRLEAALPAAAAGLAKALAIGDFGGISAAQRACWADAGIAHLLSVSGLHVAMVSAVAFLVWRRLLGFVPGAGECFAVRRAAAWAVLPVVLLYCLATGAAAAAVRSGVMAAVYFAGLAIGRPSAALNALGCAGALMVLGNPWLLHDPGCLLSFTAVLTLLLLARDQPGEAAAGWAQRGWRWLQASWRLSLCVTCATAPIVVWFFGRVSLAAPLTNMVAVPLGTFVATPLAIAFAAVAGWWRAAEIWLAIPLGHVLRLLDGGAAMVAGWPGAAVDVPAPAWWQLLAYVGLTLVWVSAAHKKSRLARYGAGALALLLVTAAAQRVMVRYRGTGRLTAIQPHVGQGDATLLLLPRGGVMLVDSGGASVPQARDPGRGVLAPLLRRLGVHTIDVAVLTHPHPDHIGGFAYLAEHFRIKEFWLSGVAEEEPQQQALLARLRAGGSVVRLAAELSPESLREGVKIEVLHPRPPAGSLDGLPYYAEMNTNNNSVVLRVSLGARSLLLPGDAEAPAEALLRERFVPTDIVKVPHHGSATASSLEFVAAVRPQLATILCGKNNPFHLPHGAVVQRYREHGATVLRSDAEGMIEMHTDGIRWRIETARGTRLQVP